MKHTTTRKWLARGGTLALVLACVACNQQTTRSNDACQLTATNHIDHLFAEVSDKLADPLCHYEYPDYRDRLLQAAKGSPGPENEARFAGMLRESIDRGIISKRQGQALFSQYFDAEFYAVKAESRSSCASLRQKQELYTDMREELAYKRIGMLEILDDESRFRSAQRHYRDLQLVLDAVEVACTQDV